VTLPRFFDTDQKQIEKNTHTEFSSKLGEIRFSRLKVIYTLVATILNLVPCIRDTVPCIRDAVPTKFSIIAYLYYLSPTKKIVKSTGCRPES
jgi:hypothetical protein